MGGTMDEFRRDIASLKCKIDKLESNQEEHIGKIKEVSELALTDMYGIAFINKALDLCDEYGEQRTDGSRRLNEIESAVSKLEKRIVEDIKGDDFNLNLINKLSEFKDSLGALRFWNGQDLYDFVHNVDVKVDSFDDEIHTVNHRIGDLRKYTDGGFEVACNYRDSHGLNMRWDGQKIYDEIYGLRVAFSNLCDTVQDINNRVHGATETTCEATRASKKERINWFTAKEIYHVVKEKYPSEAWNLRDFGRSMVCRGYGKPYFKSNGELNYVVATDKGIKSKLVNNSKKQKIIVYNSSRYEEIAQIVRDYSKDIADYLLSKSNEVE